MQSGELEERALAYVLKHEGGMASLASYLKTDHFEVEIFRAVYKLLAAIWDRKKRVPTERELKSLLEKAVEKNGAAVTATVAAYVEKVYTVDVTEVTFDEVVESIYRTEANNLAAEQASLPIAEFSSKMKDLHDRYHPLLEGSTARVFTPLDPNYMERLVKEAAQEDGRRGHRFGFQRIDRLVRGRTVYEGELVLTLALTNRGKTAWLVGAFVPNLLQQGCRVAYYSLDVSEVEIINRFRARVSGMSLDADDFGSPEYQRAINYRVDEWYERWGIDRDSFKVIPLAANRYTVNGLKGMHRNIAQLHDHYDVVMFDYGQQIKSASKYTSRYDAVGDVFNEMQGWAKDDHFTAYTAGQIHRKGYEVETINMQNIADGFNMTWPAQYVFSINQKMDERRSGLITPMRVALLKNTKGRSQVVFPFKVQWDTMTFEENFDVEPYDINELKAVSDEDKPRRSRRQEVKEDKPLIRRRETQWAPRVTDEVGDITPEGATN